MKLSLGLLVIFLCICQHMKAQSFRKPDASPGDIAYFPDHFAHDRKEGQKAIIRITYHRPYKKDRAIFGSLVPFGEVWRTGANEATEIKLYQDVNFAGKKLSAGTYSFFTIPGEKEWTIIFNKALDYWGAYSYKQDQDVLRVKANAKRSEQIIEAFSIQMAETTPNSGILYLGWDDTVVELPFSY